LQKERWRMSSSRWAGLLAAVALVGGGCAPASSGARTAPTSVAVRTAPTAVVVRTAPTAVVAPVPSDLVVVQTGQGLAAFDWATRRTVYQTSNAVPTSDWSQLVVSDQNGGRATLNVLDGHTGVQKHTIQVPGGLVPAAFSTDGRRVALAPADGDNPWQPTGREHTQVVVADPTGAVEPRTYDLRGNYAPDAFASDDQHLFVLEYQPPASPDRYRVRSLDLKTGAVSGVGSRSKTAVPEETMRGTRRASVLSPDRHVLFTLYTNQPEHLHSRDLAAGLTQSSGDVYAFVHVLNLTEGWAYCLDLPQPFGQGPASAHALALSADGQRLYVTDRSSGKIAVADTNLLTIRTVADVGADAAANTFSAATGVGLSGSLFLTSASELLVVDAGTLKVQRRLPLPATPTGLGVSPDGRRLFISTADRVLAIDPVSGVELAGLEAAGAQRIEHVGTL